MEEHKDSNSEVSISDSLLPKWMILEEYDRDKCRVGQSKERIRSISQKLNKLKQGLQVDKDRVRIVLESKLQDLEKKINDVISSTEAASEYQKNNVENLVQSLEQERLARELLDERKTKEASVLEKQMKIELQQVKTDMSAEIDSCSLQVGKIQKQLEHEKSARKESEQRFGIQLAEQVDRLGDELNHEKERNVELEQKVGDLESKLEVSNSKLLETEKSLMELHNKFSKSLEDICARVQVEIVKERKEREAMEENVLKLIEMTCQQVEEASSLA